ncbi:MAG: alpha/beta hydrolase [Gordonia sp. (in: high G+C Gram-positive bacteria)]
MRPTIPALRAWDLTALFAAGEAAARTGHQLTDLLDSVLRAADAPDDWHGATHFAVLARVIAERDHAQEVRNVLLRIADETLDAATDLGHARLVALHVADRAQTSGFRVSDDGHVSHPQASHAEEATSITVSIQEALDVVDQSDEQFGARLETLRGDLAAMTEGQAPIEVPGLGRIDADALVSRLRELPIGRRRHLLGTLAPDDMRRLITADPETLGNLDGVPFADRAVANEINIRNALATEVGLHGPDTSRANALRSLLTPAPTVSSKATPTTAPSIHDPDDGLTERTFISFANVGNGRVIEMVGRLDRGTQSATVYVPGTSTNIENFGGANREAAWNLADATGGPVFLYLDGDLPQVVANGTRISAAATHAAIRNQALHLPIVTPSDIRHALADSAADPRYAADMAPRLVDFGQALDAELQETSPLATTTVVGHSYGGSVVGTAEQLGLHANRVIYASSAGTGIYDQPWRYDDVERYSLTAPGDPIHLVQALPGSPHGGDTDTAPGVTRLDTGTYADGEVVAGLDGHGGYWNDPDSTAFRNMVDVITGETPSTYLRRMSDYPAQTYLDDVLGAVGIHLPGSARPPQ